MENNLNATASAIGESSEKKAKYADKPAMEVRDLHFAYEKIRF